MTLSTTICAPYENASAPCDAQLWSGSDEKTFRSSSHLKHHERSASSPRAQLSAWKLHRGSTTRAALIRSWSFDRGTISQWKCCEKTSITLCFVAIVLAFASCGKYSVSIS